jgi:hypothetical protein
VAEGRRITSRPRRFTEYGDVPSQIFDHRLLSDLVVVIGKGTRSHHLLMLRTAAMA